jgi:type I restriction enzyme R subunit
MLAATMNFVLADPDRKTRFTDQVLALVKAFALAGASDKAQEIRDDVRFFADIRSAIVKLDTEGDGRARRYRRARHRDRPARLRGGHR